MNDRMGSPTTRSPRASRAQSAKDQPSISPGKAFTALLALLIASGSVLLLTRPESKVQTQNADLPRSDNFALTDAEAAERFSHLEDLLNRAYIERDMTLSKEYLAPNSPLLRIGIDEITQLREDQVMVEPRITTRSIRVLSNKPDTIVIQQVAREHPRFVSESGEDVSTTDEPIITTIKWTLVRAESEWLLWDAELRNSETLK